MNPKLIIRRVSAAITGALVAGAMVAITPAPAPAAGPIAGTQPDTNQPRVMNGRVFAIDTYGPLVAVGGSFTAVRRGSGGGGDISRQWIFMFNKSTGQIVDSFQPQLSGPTPITTGLIADQPGVEAIEFAPDGQSLYVGGWFTSVNGESVSRVARLNLDGSRINGFNVNANGAVRDMALVGDRLILGGSFGRLNNAPVQKLASVDPTTGATQNDFNLEATVARDEFGTYIQELEASPNGNWLAVAGNFQQIGGTPRNQLALVDLRGVPKVANWSTDAYAPDCASNYDDSYIRGLSISPDNSYLVVSTTGAHRSNNIMCDSATRWELPPTVMGDGIKPTWNNQTGGDTYWASYVTDGAVYVGGHARWANNSNPTPGGDSDGPGSVVRQGIVALDPLTGVPLSWNPGRDRGRGAEVITGDASNIFVGHDTDFFAGILHQRLAVLPRNGGIDNPDPEQIDLPVRFTFEYGGNLRAATFNGQSLSSSSAISGPSIDGNNWSGMRDGFAQRGTLHYYGSNSAFYKRSIDGGFGPATNLSSTVGYVDNNSSATPYDQPLGVAETRAAAYYNGQIYYVKSNDDRLWKRGYSLESGIIESRETLAATQSFGSVRAMEFIGEWLYAAWSDGRLYRFYAPGGQVQYSTRTLLDNGQSINWSQVRGIYATATSGTAQPPTPPATEACGDEAPWQAKYWNNLELVGAPTTVRCEVDVDYNWGSSAPSGSGVGPDNFSAAWTKRVTLNERAAIRISVTADDGVRAFVDGVRVIDSWIDSSAALRTGTSGPLDPGEHTIRIEYYERGGSAVAQVDTELVAAPPPDPGPDTVEGNTSITLPDTNQVLQTNTVNVTGEATDNRAVDQVRVAVYNRNNPTNRWLQANGSWGSAYAYRMASLSNPGAAETDWSFSVNLPEGDYAIDARTVDGSGNEESSSAWRPFSVDLSPTVDNVKPTQQVTYPAARDVLTSGTFTATGTASDNQSLDSVRVAVRNTNTNQWLQTNGTWGGGYAFRQANLGSPANGSTPWSLPLDLPNGDYALDVRARDGAGNLADSTWNPFTIDPAGTDTQAPETQVTAPGRNEQVGRNVTVAGTATDDRGIQRVRVAIYNRGDSTNRWLQANGSWGPNYFARSAVLASPGAASTDWSLNLNLPDGLYGVDAIAVDTSFKRDPSSAWQPFQVGADTTSPATRAASVSTKKQSVVVQGTSVDNQAVRLVRVKVYSVTKKKWLKRKKVAWIKKTNYRDADMQRPGARKTKWKLKVRLPKGKYIAYAITRDATLNDGAARKVKFKVKRR